MWTRSDHFPFVFLKAQAIFRLPNKKRSLSQQNATIRHPCVCMKSGAMWLNPITARVQWPEYQQVTTITNKINKQKTNKLAGSWPEFSALTDVISACSCWLVGRLFIGVFPGVVFLCTFLTKQNTPMIAMMRTRNPPTTAAISTVMLSVNTSRPFLECALVLDSARDEFGLNFRHIKKKNRKLDKNTNGISST